MKYWKQIYIDKPVLSSIKTMDKNHMPVIHYEPIFYDSETSKETEIKNGVESVVDTWVYLWMCGVGDYLYYGRYLHEFFDLLQYMVDFYGLDPQHKIDIWIHNASYDVSYMYDLLIKFNGGTMDGINTIFIKERQLICWEFEDLGISIKCTYRLTNRSLAKWCEDLKVEQAKLTGIKDYSAKFFPWDKLPKNEYKYGAYDIISLKQCFFKELEIQGYNYANCPMTQTGFVRKDFQKAYNDKKKYKSNHSYFRKTRVSIEQYRRLLKAAQGGYTAPSIKTIGQKIEHEAGIGHVDFSSHYPTQMKIRLYPYEPNTVKEVGDDKNIKFSYLSEYIRLGYFFVVDIALRDIELKPEVSMPFLSESKCVKGPGTKIKSVNGKVIKVEGEIRICVTNLDLKIYTEQYIIKGAYIYALDTYTARKLPDYVLKTVDKYYATKSELKEDPELEENEDKQMTYLISKQKVNGVFGCCYQRPVRESFTINPETFMCEPVETVDEEELNKYYDEKHERTSCLAFQWGVWTTAWARFELYTVMKNPENGGVIGYDADLYGDTDSVFYKSTPEIEERVQEYRKMCYQDAVNNGYFCRLSDDRIQYYHDLSPEKDHLKSTVFKALHAKCYATMPNGKLKCTIAGVSKRSKDGTITREEELGSIDELKIGKKFVACGGTRADYSTLKEYEGYTGGGAAILENIKTIHDTKNDYIRTKADIEQGV